MKSFKGENLITAVSLIRGAVALLDNNESLPMDIEKIVFKILKTSSTPDFNTFTSMLENSFELKIQSLDLDQILDKVQNKYKEYTDDDKWVRFDSDEAIFKVEEGTEICWNCYKPGHQVKDCPEEIMRDSEGRDWKTGRGRGPNGPLRGVKG